MLKCLYSTKSTFDCIKVHQHITLEYHPDREVYAWSYIRAATQTCRKITAWEGMQKRCKISTK